ncbi:MAG: carbohydrate ABC transporter permease [Lachnospirales bacterium]
MKRNNWTALAFVLPNFIGFIIFILLPIIFSFFISFTNFNLFKGIDGITFVGLDNFVTMFKDPWFIDAVKNNLKYTIITIPCVLSIAIVLSTILNNKVYGKNILRITIFLPYVSSVVAASVVWAMLFNPNSGFINEFLRFIGINNPPGWLGSTTWAMAAIIIVGIWMGIGYNTVVYMAGLQGIDRSLYESSEIDGANGIQQFFKITVPMLRNTTFFLLITSIIGSFQVFGTVNIMTDGGPGRSTTVVAHYIYVSGFRFHKMGYAAAMSWMLLIFIFLITLFQWKIQARREKSL